MSWESIGSTSSGQMPYDEAWILMNLSLARTLIVFVCGEPPANSKLDIMWHEHELGHYPSLGVWSEYEHPWDYINSCERVIEVFDDAVSWIRLKDFAEEQVSAVDEDDEDNEAETELPQTAAIELLAAFKASAARCAHEMLNNAFYIQKELPSIDLEGSYREQIAEVCSGLVWTKHDVISELHDLDEVDAAADSVEVQRRVRRVVDWAAEEIPMAIRGQAQFIRFIAARALARRHHPRFQLRHRGNVGQTPISPGQSRAEQFARSYQRPERGVSTENVVCPLFRRIICRRRRS